MKYSCLIIDHDDTVIDSNEAINYPAFKEAMKQIKPNTPIVDKKQFMALCAQLGAEKMYRDYFHFTKEEYEQETKIWRKISQQVHAPFFDGMSNFIHKFKENGGHIIVYSLAESNKIKKDYQNELGFEPDYIFGYDLPKNQRKPSPYAFQKIKKVIPSDQIIYVDDAPIGINTAKNEHLTTIGAAWGEKVPHIKEWLEKNCNYTFEDVNQFAQWAMSDN